MVAILSRIGNVWKLLLFCVAVACALPSSQSEDELKWAW
jgi:hypothetical protein